MSPKGLIALLVSVWLAFAGPAFAHDKPAPDKPVEPGLKDVLTHMIADMANAVSERPNESKEQQSIRAQVATQMITGLQPRDGMEAILRRWRERERP